MGKPTTKPKPREELPAWRERMTAITERLKANPHRAARDNGPDGHFHRGIFIAGVARDDIELAFEGIENK
jgi:hypothetical protein